MLRSIRISRADLRPNLFDELPIHSCNAVHLKLASSDLGPPLLSFLSEATKYNVAVHATIPLHELQGAEDLCRQDALGHRFPQHLCPSQPQVQELWLAECQTISAFFPWASLEMAGLGFSGSPDFYPSICFCAACMYGYGATGLVLEQVARENMEEPTEHPHPSVNTLLLWRRSVQYGILRLIHEAVPSPLCLKTAATIRYTGDRSSLSFQEAQGLAATCLVSWTTADPQKSREERTRLESLPRPMPVYAELPYPSDWDDSMAAAFSGAVFSFSEGTIRTE
ncbi:hypothetical protein [Bryobacter aggregatus]|uniref:hypothetical protein n=1 Tax=Bryobacter aggregatus TaxID=360054 RepID=UPI0004E223E8|nr:hypothetical protein [Bryobacter aggregatus]